MFNLKHRLRIFVTPYRQGYFVSLWQFISVKLGVFSRITRRSLAFLTALTAALLPLSWSHLVQADSVAISYQSSQQLSVGTLVSLKQAGSKDIEKATTDNQDLIVGVVTQTTDTVINVQPAGSNVPLVTSGQTQLLVSTAGGNVKAGDDLVISPIAGVAMKPNNQASGARFVATARQGFSSNSSGVQKITAQKEDGGTSDIYVGLVNVDLRLDKGTFVSNGGDNILTNAAERITGRKVTTSRVMASSAIAVSSIAVTGVLLQGAVRGTFLSLGRNPLAHADVMPALLRVIILSIVFLGCGFTIAYATLVL